jgi:hypothetical protein
MKRNLKIAIISIFSLLFLISSNAYALSLRLYTTNFKTGESAQVYNADFTNSPAEPIKGTSRQGSRGGKEKMKIERNYAIPVSSTVRGGTAGDLKGADFELKIDGLDSSKNYTLTTNCDGDIRTIQLSGSINPIYGTFSSPASCTISVIQGNNSASIQFFIASPSQYPYYICALQDPNDESSCTTTLTISPNSTTTLYVYFDKGFCPLESCSSSCPDPNECVGPSCLPSEAEMKGSSSGSTSLFQRILRFLKAAIRARQPGQNITGTQDITSITITPSMVQSGWVIIPDVSIPGSGNYYLVSKGQAVSNQVSNQITVNTVQFVCKCYMGFGYWCPVNSNPPSGTGCKRSSACDAQCKPPQIRE